MRQKNIIAALVLISVTIGYGILTADLPIRTLPNTPDPSFFPWLNTIIILLLSGLLLLSGSSNPKVSSPSINRLEQNRVVAAMAAFIVYLAIMPRLGFILATIPFFSAMMVMFGERRPIFIGFSSLIATASLYVLFRHGFGVFLPRGLLTGILA